MTRDRATDDASRRIRWRWATLGWLSVMLLVIATACTAPGGDDDGGGEAAGDEQGEIVIGSAMPLTGFAASDGQEMLQGLEMAVDEYNEDGGILGRQLRLVTCDVAAMDVDAIQSCAERILGENPDAVITGYDDSGVNTLAFGLGEMPYLHAVTMEAAVQPVRDDPEQYGNVFQYDPSDYDYGPNATEKLIQVADELGFDPSNNRVAVITSDFSYNSVAADAFKETITAEGYEVVIDEVLPYGEVVEEWGPIISQIEREQPQFVTFWIFDTVGPARFMNQFARHFSGQGIEALVYMQYVPIIPEFMELTGDSAEGLLWSTVVGATDAVGRSTVEYTERFAERYGNEPQSFQPYYVRDAFDIWAAAVEETGCVECFDEVAEAIRNIRFDGYVGVITFAPLEEGQYGLPGDELIPTLWSQVQGGENVAVLPENVAEAEVQPPPWVPGN
jgi:branched-chain amino acid transport system substrate-binding protein